MIGSPAWVTIVTTCSKYVQRHGALTAALALVVVAVWIVRRELPGVSGQQIALASHGLSSTDFAVAALLTIASYAVLTGYELLAFANAGVPLARSRIVLASFVGCAISNTVGLSLLSGTAIRYRFYARWKVPARQVSGIVAFYSGTFWLGLMVLGGWGLWQADLPLFPGSSSVTWTKLVGAGLLLTSSLYLVASVAWRHPRIGGRSCNLPGWRVATAQYLLSILDWTLSAGVLWVLLPDAKPAFSQVGVAFVIAQLIGLASHIPGGIGAFEALIVGQLGHLVPIESLMLALVAFRGIYYAVPFAAAMGIMAAYEVCQWCQLNSDGTRPKRLVSHTVDQDPERVGNGLRTPPV